MAYNNVEYNKEYNKNHYKNGLSKKRRYFILKLAKKYCE